jgi:hypothetical protein
MNVETEQVPLKLVERHHAIRLWIALAIMFLAALACAGGMTNLVVGDIPQYICPSATPRATNTPYATSTPTWPAIFQANLNFYLLGTNQDGFIIQWVGQSVGNVYAAWAGTPSDGSTWNSGLQSIGYAGYTYGPFYGSWYVPVPMNVALTSVSIQAGAYSVNYLVIRLPVSYYGNPGGYPCCAPPAIYPTPVATYTPYPTPTLYVRQNDYFIGDPVYNYVGQLKVRFKLLDLRSQPSRTPGPGGQPQNVYVWTFEVTNRRDSAMEYDFYPPVQMYISDITLPGGSSLQGVWGPSQAAADEAGVPHDNYQAFALQPGQSQTFTLAAYAPVGTIYRIGYVLDSTQRSTPGQPGSAPTQVPGRNTISWLNQVNTVCKGDIKEP